MSYLVKVDHIRPFPSQKEIILFLLELILILDRFTFPESNASAKTTTCMHVCRYTHKQNLVHRHNVVHV